MPTIAGRVLDWYAEQARDLPWRHPGVPPWGVLVSEVMLHQTPVARVVDPWQAWLARWPTPAALADDSPGAAVRMWGRLGYPRRALQLHVAAGQIVERHGGAVPSRLDDLLALPGVGAYTARAVASFAYGQRHPVVDTNVRRLLTRVLRGEQHASGMSTTRDLALAESVLPDSADDVARFGVAAMEFGALVCTARAPRCDHCPLVDLCAWHRAGSPIGQPRPRRPGYAGTDRAARGALLAVVRTAEAPVTTYALRTAWPESTQRRRALHSLLADGLIRRAPEGRYALPN